MPTRPTLPGRPVRGSTSGRPLMAALDLFGRRWMLRVMWELRDGPAGFRDLLTRCDGISNAVLSTRLSELVESRLIAHTDDRAYVLTDLGSELCRAIAPLDAWSRRWAADLSA
jgi:DNA-binding HxlR family transcriptional regulator